MGASVFVGRVGGLAVALGVGAAMFSTGMGVAFADSGSQTNTSTASAGKTSGANRVARAPRVRAAKPAATARKARSAAADPVAAEPDPVAVESDPVALESPVDAPDPVVDADAPEVIAYNAAPEPVAGAVKRGPRANASTGLTANPTYQFFDGVIQGNLNVASESGCGTLGSTCKLEYKFVGSSAGGKLNLNNVPNGLPGGAPLIQGANGSFTFLPYATWIDPDNPDRAATPSVDSNGNQSFSVEIREKTQLNQTLSNIPLFGSINQKIINGFQDIGWFSGLIGSALLSTVNVETNLTVLGRPVAYTYTVSSFDGTPISMNYFPASEPSLSPLFGLGGQQATIFNGPGLGSPGETNPYGSFQAGGSVPGLGLMRGQGLPTTPINLSQAPLGFNVITWDPRGEFASGGILQLDNPFYEGRDVSALIDWANANTNLLNENQLGALVSPCSPGEDGCSPDVAMMGGSYGGGIQMTTIDPRVKTIVPSIAWNSLNNSLYPGAIVTTNDGEKVPINIFKTAWANTLAAFLLLLPNETTGTTASSVSRVNSQITQALITGNLFGYISPSAQAVLSSSGPTSLLTKLSIPTFYDQGIVDALFPLQQASDNLQTQLNQNPFFAGTHPNPLDPGGDPVPNAAFTRLLWFCGGHGVCTTQSPAQLTQQASLMFLENILWVNNYAKNYFGQIPLPAGAPTLKALTETLLAFTPAFQWWDQTGYPLATEDYPFSSEFQGTPIAVTGVGDQGRINSFTSRTGPLKSTDAAGGACATIAQACEFPLNQVFATEADNAINIDIPVPASETGTNDRTSVVVGVPTVSFTYSGTGNAKAVYAQIVDNATGQVLGNINTPIPVILKKPWELGKPEEYTVTNFPLANIAYTAPLGTDGSLTLQIVGNSSLYKNNDVIWSVDISDVSVSLPTSSSPANFNPLADFLGIYQGIKG